MARLTYTNKRKWNPIIVRQTGYYCFFCKCPNTPETPLEYGHLNGNRDDSRPENLAYMCHPCNNKMKTDFDMHLLANDQLIKNENAVLACERTDATEDSSQQETSRINKQLTYTFLLERTMNGDELLLTFVMITIRQVLKLLFVGMLASSLTASTESLLSLLIMKARRGLRERRLKID